RRLAARARDRLRVARPPAALGRARPQVSPAADRVAAYLRMAGLESLSGREADVERAVRDLLEAMTEKVAVGDPASLYSYPVPMLTEDGACSIVDALAPVPYDLGAI